MNFRTDEFSLSFYLKPSYEVLHLNTAIQETKRIEAQLQLILNNVKKLYNKFQTPKAREYFCFFNTPDEMKCDDFLTLSCCSLINEQSHNDDSNFPQNHQQTCKKITNDHHNLKTTITTSSFFNKIINHNHCIMIEKQNNKNIKQHSPLPAPTFIQFHASNCVSCCNGTDPKTCCRKPSEYTKSYNTIKLQTIKMKREMERTLLLFDRAFNLSEYRAKAINNYIVHKILEPTIQKLNPREIHFTRRSISTPSCQMKTNDSRQFLRTIRSSPVLLT